MRFIIIFSLALKQIRKEKFIYSCQILAIAAVLVPILIILGLKHGMITGMKEELLSYPSTLELRPSKVFEINEENLAQIRSWPETQFAIAMPNVNGLMVHALPTPQTSTPITIEEHASALSCDLKVSAHGDPLMKTANCAPPKEGELVISQRLAKHLNLSQGDEITLSITRNENKEHWYDSFKIIGILPSWASSRSELYGTEALVSMIEEYQRSGRGTPGDPANVNFNAYQALLLDSSIDDKQGKHLASLSQMSSFQRSLSLPGLKDGTPLLLRHGLRFEGTELNHLISTAEQSEPAFIATPWNPPIRVKLGEQHYSLINQASLFHGSATLCEAPAEIYVNPALRAAAEGTPITINSADGESTIYCDIIEDANVAVGELWASPQLVALAHQGSRMVISWDYRTGSLRYPLTRSLGLRLYASGLEETEALYNKMRQINLPCNAKLSSIQQLLSLERSLNIIFLIVSGFAALGGSLALAFNLFNAIERHRKEYALLQLLGVGKFYMMILPFIESLIITLSAMVFALAVFYSASNLIAYSFPQFEDASTICILTEQHIIYLTIIGITLSFLASFSSAIRVLSISPSEIIRES